jgi:hypothetical protein
VEPTAIRADLSSGPLLALDLQTAGEERCGYVLQRGFSFDVGGRL